MSNTIQIKIAKSDSDFVGIECQNNHMIITFPIGYDIQEDIISIEDKTKIFSYQKDVFYLLKVLEDSNNSNYFECSNNQFSFSAGIYLINDYFKNGLVRLRILKDNQNNYGSIDFRKTISTKIPIFNMGNLIYTDAIYKSIEQVNDEITEIQKQCLHKAFLVLNIFYNNYQVISNCNYSKEQMLYKIENALTRTNVDSDKKRLDMMKKFIMGTSIQGINSKEVKVGRNDFHVVWEKILRKKVYDLYPKLDILPSAYYIINKDRYETSPLIPDIIAKNNNTIYLIDAKYYKNDNLPQTSDISKQLFYDITNAKIKNIFLLPKKIENNNKYEYLGYATVDSYKNKNGGKINTFYLDTKTIIESKENIMNKVLNEAKF